MIVISDTNILSSFAAADSLYVLLRLFPQTPIYISPAVLEEVQVALDKGYSYLSPLIEAITTNKLPSCRWQQTKQLCYLCYRTD